MTRFITAFVLVALVLRPNTAEAAELKTLVRQYQSAVKKIKGAKVAQQVKSSIRPIVDKIAKIDDNEALGFMVGEFGNARAEIAAVFPAAILQNSNEKAPDLILGGFSKKSVVVQVAVLRALAKTERDLSGSAAPVVSLLRIRLRPEVRIELPAAVAKLENAKAAEALLLQIPAKSSGRKKIEDDKFKEAVATSLAKMEDASFKDWLGDGALNKLKRNSGAVEVALRLIAKFEVKSARKDVASLVTHKSPEVAAAAVSTLVRLGVGDSVKDIGKAVKRHKGGDTSFRIEALDALAASGDKEALAIVLEMAKDKNPETRAIALGSLARVPNDKRAVAAIAAALKDSNASVKAVALRSLSRMRTKSMIGPLIEALDEAQPYAFRVKALEALVTNTGNNMGLVKADWVKWWSLAEARFKFPKKDEEGFTTVRAYDLDYFGIEISSKRMTFVVDISSSMRQEVAVSKRKEEKKEDEGEGGRTRPATPEEEDDRKKLGEKAKKIDILKIELARVIKKLTADTAINIVTFDAVFRTWQKKLQMLSRSGRAKAVKFVEGISTGSGTNVFDSVEAALKDDRVDTIYLMTDGNPTRGRITDPAAILKEVAKLNRVRAVTIHCIAFGEESDLLKDLAEENGGKYRFVDEY